MSLPPWYRPRKRPLAEAVLSINLSSASGIGPLVPGLSVRWDMTPLLCLSDPSYRVRMTVDSKGRTVSITRRHKCIATVSLARDLRRIGTPLRAICGCGRLCYRLYLWGRHFYCGKCLRVTYASGQRGENDRAHARIQRLESRLEFTRWRPRHRDRRKIQGQIARQDERLWAAMPASLHRALAKIW